MASHYKAIMAGIPGTQGLDSNKGEGDDVRGQSADIGHLTAALCSG
jgi:hypothetical protein